MKGVIINGECIDEAGASHLHFYGVLQDGSNFLWRESKPYLLLFASSKVSDSVLGASKVLHDSFKTMDGRPVSLHYFDSEAARRQAAQSLDERNHFEGDLEPSTRYLMEKGFLGRVDFGDSSFKTEGNLKVFEGPKTSRTPEAAAVKALSIDIETGNGNQDLYSIGLHGASLDGGKATEKVLMVGDDADDDFVKYCADEKALLRAFVEEVAAENPQIFIGWNVVNFDFDFLVKKFKQHNIPFSIGIDGKPVQAFYGKNAKDLVLNINGRLVLDGISTLRLLGVRLPDYRLDTAAHHLLGKSKLISQSGHSKVQEIEHLFRSDKKSLARYNLQDCVLVSEIFRQTNAIQYRLRHLFLTGVYLEKQMSPTTVLDYLYLPKLHRRKVAAPNPSKKLSDLGPSFENIPEWKGGLYGNVVRVSFRQLLASIVETFKVDPLGKMQADAEPEKAIKNFKGIPFHRTEHILPELVTHYKGVVLRSESTGDRLTAKVSQSILNSLLGALKSDRSRFALSGLHDAIIKNASSVVQRSVQAIESWGAKVAHADHNGIFVADVGDGSLWVEGRKLAKRLTNFLAAKLEEDFGAQSHLEAEVDEAFSKIFFLDQRPASLDKLEARYVGLLEVEGQESSADAKRVEGGLESFGRDYLSVVVDLQKEIIDDLLAGENPTARIRRFKESMLAKEQDAKLVFERRLKKSVEDYQKGAPPHVVAASKIVGEKPFYIRYLMTKSGPEPTSNTSAPIDYEYYLNKQLKPMLQSVLANTSYSGLIEEATDLNDQLNLFAAN